MNPDEQLAVVAFLFTLPPGILGAALGWWAGRRALRLALDPARLPLVAEPEVRLVDDTLDLPKAGRFAVDDELVWSEVQAHQDQVAAQVDAQAAETAAEIHDMTVAASELIPARWRHEP